MVRSADHRTFPAPLMSINNEYLLTPFCSINLTLHPNQRQMRRESRHRHSAASSGPKSIPILNAEGNQLELILNIREAKPLQILLRLRNAANRSRHMPAATSTPKSHQLRRPARYGTRAPSSAACCTPPCCRTCRGISRGRGFGKSGWRTETAFQRRVRSH